MVIPTKLVRVTNAAIKGENIYFRVQDRKRDFPVYLIATKYFINHGKQMFPQRLASFLHNHL